MARLPGACSDERAAVEFFEWLRWPEGAACPRCGDVDVRQLRDSKSGERNKRYLWRCRGCKRQFTVRIRTVLEDSPIPLTIWAQAFWGLCAGKKGCSSKQVQRMTGLSYKSALYLTHRIRWAFADPVADADKLRGVLEADETYIGGKPRYPLGHPKRKKYRDKVAVVAILQRGAGIRASVSQSITADSIRWALETWAERGSTLITDERAPYATFAPRLGLRHHRLRHWRREYVRVNDREIHSNSIESFWAVLKRGLHGTYHAVSKEHLHRYLAEFQFRHNTRKLTDGERLAQAVRRADGRRLCYMEPGSGAA